MPDTDTPDAEKITLTRADLLGYARVRGMAHMAEDQRDTIVHLDSDLDWRRVPAHIAQSLAHVHDSFGECIKRRRGSRCGEVSVARPSRQGDVVIVNQVERVNGLPRERGIVTTFDDPVFKAWSESNRPTAPSPETLLRGLMVVVFPSVGRWGWYAPDELQVITEEAGS